MNRLIISIIIILVLAAGAGVFFVFQKPDLEKDLINAKLNSEFQLKVNQTAIIDSENLKIKFLNVIADSRCPLGVQCVWAGQTTIAVNIQRNNKNIGDFNLVIGPNQDSSIKSFDGYSVKLIKVEPYPKQSQKIEISDYSVTLKLFNKKEEGSAPISYPQKFHTQGNKIVDETGKEVVLRGVNIGGAIPQAYYTKFGDKPKEYLPPWEENYFKQISKMGTQIIRLGILPEEFRKSPEEFSYEVIDQAIDWVSKYQMYVYITYHGIGFPPTEYYGEEPWKIEEKFTATKEEMLNFWDKISKRYKDNKVVAFYEIFNEPTHSGSKAKLNETQLEKDWLLWKDFAEQVVDVIRKNDPDSVIIIGGLEFAYDVSFALKNPIERENIIYATHPYPCKIEENNKSWDLAFGNVKEKYPVFATEFSVNGLAAEASPISCASVQNELRKLVNLEDLIEEAKKYPGNKQKLHEITLKAFERIKNNKAAFDYLINEREEYKREINVYLENKKISWTGFIFYSIYPEFSMINKDYTLTEQGEWFKQWMQSKIPDKNLIR